jgi:hypothetical protein
MLVRALHHCDTKSGRALFSGQQYELSEDEALPLLADGMAESLEPRKVRAQDKSVQGPDR